MDYAGTAIALSPLPRSAARRVVVRRFGHVHSSTVWLASRFAGMLVSARSTVSTSARCLSHDDGSRHSRATRAPRSRQYVTYDVGGLG